MSLQYGNETEKLFLRIAAAEAGLIILTHSRVSQQKR